MRRMMVPDVEQDAFIINSINNFLTLYSSIAIILQCIVLVYLRVQSQYSDQCVNA